MDPVILTCAVSGSSTPPDNHPHYPRTPKAIAESAVEAVRAGATAVHIHARDPRTGAHSRGIDHFREIVDRIADSDVDPIVNLTCGGGARFYPDPADPTRASPKSDVADLDGRVAHIRALRPEVASLDISTFSRASPQGDMIFFNPTGTLRDMARTFRDLGVKTELEVYHPGDLEFGKQLIQEGLMTDPPFVQFVLGVKWAMPASVESILYLRGLLPPGSRWVAFGLGRQQMPMVAASVILGGNARVGLEDNWYLDRGVFASNADLVARARTIITSLGYQVATPDEGRAMLGIRGPQAVAAVR